EKWLAAVAEEAPRRDVRGQAALTLGQELLDKSEHARLLRVAPWLADEPVLRERASALETMKRTDPDAAAREAEKWLRLAAEKYAEVQRGEGWTGSVKSAAERSLFALRRLAIGKPAPEIEGEDLDGKRFKLSDYRGKVVVLI